ncbi:MAG TPA: tetratricopeptide repeat protein [Chitinophagales bacterium]|nr:tetratricopeptide repeat protein [Chitinophagales bacterium]
MSKIAAMTFLCRWACCFLIQVVLLSACSQTTANGSTDPVQNRFYNEYALIYNKLGHQPDDSTSYQLDQYLQEFAENADAQMLAGTLAYNRGDYQAAVSRYRTAINLQPAKSTFHSALGAAFNTLNQSDSANFYLQKAIALGDTSGFTWLNISILNLKRQSKALSLAAADSALAKQPNSPVICSGLSYVYLQWADTTQSKAMLGKAVSLGLADTAAFNNVLAGLLPLQHYYQKNYPY